MIPTLKCPLCDHTDMTREELVAHLVTDHPRELARAAAGLGGKNPFDEHTQMWADEISGEATR